MKANKMKVRICKILHNLKTNNTRVERQIEIHAKPMLFKVVCKQRIGFEIQN